MKRITKHKATGPFSRASRKKKENFLVRQLKGQRTLAKKLVVENVQLPLYRKYDDYNYLLTPPNPILRETYLRIREFCRDKKITFVTSPRPVTESLADGVFIWGPPLIEKADSMLLTIRRPKPRVGETSGRFRFDSKTGTLIVV